MITYHLKTVPYSIFATHSKKIAGYRKGELTSDIEIKQGNRYFACKAYNDEAKEYQVIIFDNTFVSPYAVDYGRKWFDRDWEIEGRAEERMYKFVIGYCNNSNKNVLHLVCPSNSK